MSIVRSDKRPEAIASFAEAHDNLRQQLVACDAQQANIEDLEISLGLATEATIDARDRLCVMHYPAGAAEGHTLDVCADIGCHEKDPVADLLGGDDDAEEGEGNEGERP